MKTLPPFYDDRFLRMNKSQLLAVLQIAGKDYENRISDLLIEQLRNGLVTNVVHPEKILEEIVVLEGLSKSTSRTLPAAPFKVGILNKHKLWKKHFLLPGSIGKNMLNALKLENENSNFFEQLVYLVKRKSKSNEQFAATLANVAKELFLEKLRNGKLTGEWIVFKKYERKNYYLTLASHSEKNEEIIRRILDDCRSQYPFLFEVG